MKYNCKNILKWTEAQLKYTYDVSLKEAKRSSGDTFFSGFTEKGISRSLNFRPSEGARVLNTKYSLIEKFFLPS